MLERLRKGVPDMDLNKLAKKIVDQATGSEPAEDKKNPAAVALGRLGGIKGG